MNNYLHKLNHALGQIASNMDSEHWVLLSAVALLFGFFFLRGNALRGA